jgi:hypothetical protein
MSKRPNVATAFDRGGGLCFVGYVAGASTSIVIVTRSDTSSASTPESSLAMTVRPGSGIA